MRKENNQTRYIFIGRLTADFTSRNNYVAWRLRRPIYYCGPANHLDTARAVYRLLATGGTRPGNNKNVI